MKIGGQYLNELEYQIIDGHEISDLPPGNPANQYGHYIGSMSNHDKVYENVVDVLTRDGVIATNRNRQDFSHRGADVRSLLDGALRRGCGEREA